MVTAKQQHETEYTVTLKVAGSKVKAMADAAKNIGVAVGSVEKTVLSAAGEWSDEWIKDERYTNPVLHNTDGRVIQRFEEYGDDDEIIPGKYAYYTVRNIHGGHIGTAGKLSYHIDTLEEAKTLMDVPLSQEELMATADELAATTCSFVGDMKDSSLRTDRMRKAAEAWLMGRGKSLPEEESEEEEGNRRAPEYIVTLRIKATTLPTVEKKAKATFGEKLIGVAKVGRGFSRAAELSEAEDHVKEAAEIVGELLGDMEERRDNTPENFQGGETYEAVEAAVDSLEQLKGELDGLDFDSVEFPGFCL